MAAVKTRTVTEKGFIPESAVIELWAAYYLKAVQERHAQLDLRLTAKGGGSKCQTKIHSRKR